MNIQAKYVIAILASIVVILLIIIAFMLGRGSVDQGNGGTEPSADASLSGENSSDDMSVSGEKPSADASGDYSEEEQSSRNGETQNAPRNLDISMTAGSLTFVSGNEFNVDYDSSVINVTGSGDTLKIQNDHNHPSASERDRMNVTVTVPEEYVFGSVDIEFGAGKLIVHSLSTNNLTMELGAGSATFNNILVDGSADIKEGAGELIINSGTILNLNLKCGAGATRVAAALKGSSSVTAAVGAVDIDLKGSQEDYSVSFSIGIGTCYYNGEKLVRNGTYGTGENTVEITGGLGIMRVNA